LLEFPDDSDQPRIDSVNNENSEEDEDDDTCFELPSNLTELRSELLNGYSLPEMPPDSPPPQLTASEMLSLQHYVAWKKSNGTELAYKLHAQVLQNSTQEEILSLYSVRKLAKQLTELWPNQIDMCPRSCMAYTGKFAELESCIYVRGGKICGESRYKPKPKSRPNAVDKPRAQMMFLPVTASLKAMFANEETSQLLRYRDKCLQKALHLVGTAPQSVKYSDFADSEVHMHHYKNMNLFQDSRDVAFVLSTDGAQLTMGKQSDTWILILMFLNLPPEIRYKSKSIIYPFAIPGPNAPGIIESFLYSLFEDLAQASEGIWMWDAVDSSYFVNHACICMALGDMLGSAKLNGMAGHCAIYGDRFSMVKGAKASLAKGSKSQYYPMSPPESSKYNPGRPIYDLLNLPMRKEPFYWETIDKLENANKTTRVSITRDTGISRMPLCAASPAFVHPTFFPMDPFHLFYENCMAFIWDLWVTLSEPSDPIHIHKDKACKFGQLVSEAMPTLPPSFCSPVRDPFLKRQSQYKIYEWMALLHWYTIPIGIELGFNPSVLQNFACFVEAVEIAMTIHPRSKEELANLHSLFQQFLTGFEKIYVRDNPENVTRSRLCIFQLIHVPAHIQWYGSIRIGSQATVERAIGEVGRKIRSKKSPFANLANIILERELIKLLLLHYPLLDLSKNNQPAISSTGPQQKLSILKMEQKSSQEFHQHLHAICHYLDVEFDPQLELHRWGKFRLSGGSVLRSRLGETKGNHPTRSARYFEASKKDVPQPVFGEALAFFKVIETEQLLVVYRPLNCRKVLTTWKGTWSNSIEVLPVTEIQMVVGIWSYNNSVYVLRKHPGLSLLPEEESGAKKDEDEEENDDESFVP
jgi:hypothetical protein